MLIILITVTYLGIGYYYSRLWLQLLIQDLEAKDDFFSWLAFYLGSMFWILVVPIAYSILLKEKIAESIECDT